MHFEKNDTYNNVYDIKFVLTLPNGMKLLDIPLEKL